MKQLLLFCALLLLSTVSFGQTMRMTPDSGYLGQTLNVTIVGSGMKFGNTQDVSMFTIKLDLGGGGSPYFSTLGSRLVNDSTLSAHLTLTAQLPPPTPLDYYDLEVDIKDTAVHEFRQDSAFHLIAPPPSIVSISPSSAYDSQTVTVTITGQSTNFLNGATPQVSFFRNGATGFNGTVDSVISGTSLRASVTVPTNAVAGAYSVIVSNSQYSDTGISRFTVLGPPPSVTHVPMTMVPDSGYLGETLSVTIVGNGTHFNATTNSSINISFEQNGQVMDQERGFVTNDSTLSLYLQVGPSFQLNNYYDLNVELTDINNVDRTFIRDSAFHIVPAPPSIVSVSPSSAYDSQTVSMNITGQNTNFTNGATPTVAFEQNGTTFFSGTSVNVASNTSVTTAVTVPVGMAAGTYDVVVQNGNYSLTGSKKFTVLGPQPTAQISPDSGAASTEFDVSVIGQNTNFATTANSSMPLTMNIDLKQNGIDYYHTTADSVESITIADAIFSLPDSLQAGIYDAEITGETYSGTFYDLHTPFLVTPHPIVGLPGNHNAPCGIAVNVDLTGKGMHFIYNNEDVTDVSMVLGSTIIAASNVAVHTDSTLTATFTIPLTAPPGNYDIDIREPGANRVVIDPQAFTVENASGVADNNSAGDIIQNLTVSPNPSLDHVEIAFTIGSVAPVHLWIYDELGRTVATLCDGTEINGSQQFSWDAKNAPVGNYFYELRAGAEVRSGKIVIQH